jgi:hypothetical protein
VVRATSAQRNSPVNTMAGLRARLALLSASDGQPYLPDAAASDEQLSDALRQFQRDRRLPPTGEPDGATQAQVASALEEWLRRPPPPLEPKLVARAADVTGAGLVLRGTYRIERGRVALQISLLDQTVVTVPGPPISLVFPLEQSAEKAAEVARSLLGETETVPGTQANDLSPEELEGAALTLLLVDRGMPELADQDWQSCPPRWFDWPLLAGTARSVRLRAADLERGERSLRGRPEEPLLDAAAARELFLGDLGGGWARPILRPQAQDGSTPGLWEPGPYQIVGRDGLLLIRGRLP